MLTKKQTYLAGCSGCSQLFVFLLITFSLSCLFQSGIARAQKTQELIEDSDYALGVQAFADGDFERAANLWLADAYRGSADAQFNVGVLFIEGKGVERERGEALFWFEKAARQGHPEAQYNLGHLLLEEQGDVERIREGIEWWRQSAEQGFPIAQYNYGRAVFYGIGVEVDKVGSKNWFELASEAGNERAVVFLAEHENQFVDDLVAESATKQVIVDAATPVRERQAPTEEVVSQSEYLLVGERPVLMYSRFNTFSPVVTKVDARILLRVVERVRDWIRVEVPGGVPGWIRSDQSRVDKDLVEITSDEVSARADPTESTESNDFGILSNGTKVLLLDQQAGWIRVLLPEKIPGWIEDDGIKTVSAEAAEIARVWQTQRLRLKIDALSSREARIAAIDTTKSGVLDLEVDTSDSSRIDLQKDSVLATVARVEPLSPITRVVVEQQPEPQTEIALADITSEEIELPTQQVEVEVVENLPGPNASEIEEAVAEIAAAANAIESVNNEILESGVVGGDTAAQQMDGDSVAQDVDQAAADELTASASVADTGAAEVQPVVEDVVVPLAGSEPAEVIEVETEVVEIDDDKEEDLSSAVLGAPEAAANSDTIRLTVNVDTPIRTGSSANTPSITELPRNTLVDVVGEENGFAEVIIPGGLPVWIRRSDATTQGRDNALIKGSRVRALSTPPGQDDARVLGLLPAGEVFRIVNERGNAVRIVAPEQITGWISLADLQQAEGIAGIDQVWRNQSNSLLTKYLDAELEEVAIVPKLGDVQLAGTGIPNDNSWLFEDEAKNYTLQLFSMQNQSSARSQFRSLNGRGQFFSTLIRGERWYFVLLGKFLTPEAARAVVENLPRWAKDARVRSLQRLQVNRCKKLDQYSEQEVFGLARLCSE